MLEKTTRTAGPTTGPDLLLVPTMSLHHIMNSKRAWRRAHLVIRRKFVPYKFEEAPFPGVVIPDLMPVHEHETVKFVQALARGDDPFKTELWSETQAPKMRKPKMRKIEGIRSEMSDRRAFLVYADRVRAFLEFAAKHGIQPACAGPLNKNEDADVDIGIALLEIGVVKYRKGMHRFACAVALGIATIPCRCYFLSERANLDILEQYRNHEPRCV